MWLPSWLPIASFSEDVFVDLRPGPAHGCIGPFEHHRHADPLVGQPKWSGVTAMLADIADALVNGSEILGCTATVEHGNLTWEHNYFPEC